MSTLVTQGEDNFTFNTDKTKTMMEDRRKERQPSSTAYGGRNWGELL